MYWNLQVPGHPTRKTDKYPLTLYFSVYTHTHTHTHTHTYIYISLKEAYILSFKLNGIVTNTDKTVYRGINATFAVKLKK